MAEELLSLKWNNHQAHFVDILTFLREKEIFVDATLACGGKLYAAHKFVLSTCSDYFKQMFTKNPSKHPIVFMKDVSCRDLEALLDFMYNGEVNVPQSSLGSLIKTAEGLQIKGLAVPDDPPISKRERDLLRDRRDRDSISHQDQLHSPQPKRLRTRERSPTSAINPSLSSTQSRARSPSVPVTSLAASVTSSLPPVEATLDEDSRTSAHSGISDQNSQPASLKPNIISQLNTSNSESVSADQSGQNQSSASDEPSPGPSGIHKPHHSKEEVLDIKQEDVVELGEEDDGDWGTEGDSGGGGGGGDSLVSENSSSFPEVLLPPTDGTVPSAGDTAMKMADRKLGYCGSSLRMPASFLTHPTSSTYGTADAAGNVLSNSIHTSSITAPLSRRSCSGFRPFICAYCCQRFKMKHHLKDHEKLHTGERPYKCQFCGRGFVQRSNCRLHSLRCGFSVQNNGC